MAEYIDRDALVRQIICNMAEFVGAPNDVMKHDEQCNYAISCVESAPTADVTPVVHGHFVHDGPRFTGGVDWWHCSACGGLASGAETQFAYCPNCGARMDGGDNDG